MITDDDVIELIRRAGSEGADADVDPRRIRTARDERRRRRTRLGAAASGVVLVSGLTAGGAVLATSRDRTPGATASPTTGVSTFSVPCACPAPAPGLTVRLNGGAPPLGRPRVVRARVGRPVTLTLTLHDPGTTPTRVDSLVIVAGTRRHGGVALSAARSIAANRARVYRGPATDGKQVTASFSFPEPGRYPVTVVVRGSSSGAGGGPDHRSSSRVGTVVVRR